MNIININRPASLVVSGTALRAFLVCSWVGYRLTFARLRCPRRTLALVTYLPMVIHDHDGPGRHNLLVDGLHPGTEGVPVPLAHQGEFVYRYRSHLITSRFGGRAYHGWGTPTT